MEIGGIKKKDRVVSVKVTKGDVENRIKSNDAPFAIPRNISSSTSKNSNISLNSSRSQAPLPVPSGHRLPTPKYPGEDKTPRQYQEQRRPCEDYDRFIAPNPKQKRKTMTNAKKAPTTTSLQEVDANTRGLHISYNRTIIDHLEKDRFSHPNYDVSHLVNYTEKKPFKIDARYGN